MEGSAEIYRRVLQLGNGRKFVISTDRSLIDSKVLNQALGSERMHWARAMSEKDLNTMISNSVCFGIFESRDGVASESGAMIGFARLVTDSMTFVYLTDVWISDGQTGLGLGTWLVGCVNEWVAAVPYLRQFVLITRNANEAYYTSKLGMSRMEEMPGVVSLVRKGPAASAS